ncbi:hypothetical protein [Streptococcus sp. CSL10205-OR2]|uniref:hypothetical protein n=1 Tax=Streptococcus sp. CSL10205-OR2 TaxID=2980558 RepID=UPI0021D85337|nr:hypothetical protein [Streptococcus sp. CSL10205-OR2]MCU9533700.1 hypothetical protein [Streptococcus sp. CSL10205-OR2]
MSYCSIKKKRLWKQQQEIWINEITNKVSWDNFYQYNFCENDEYTISDFEQSPLSQIIWGEIMTNYLNQNNNVSLYKYYINRYYLIIENDDNSYRFLFDVMNNLKPRYFTELTENEDYHFIGNFTPIPANNNLKRSLQFVHKNLNEDWNKMIICIKERWHEFGMNFSFDDYIKMTLQEDYYHDGIFKSISEIDDIKMFIQKRGKIIQEKCKKLFK